MNNKAVFKGSKVIFLHAFAYAFVVFFAFDSYSLAKQYHVSPLGSDTNSGSAKFSWRTIQKAAEKMKPGDTCIVHGGIYRETVTPAESGKPGRLIRFIAAEGEYVMLTGTEIISKWSDYNGSIQSAKVSWPIEQVFVDKKLMTYARWPNAKKSAFKTGMANVNIDSGKYVLEGLDNTPDFWKGGYLWGMNSRQWVARTVSITASGINTITLEGKGPIRDKGVGVLYGVFGALDSPGEWYQAGSMLYLWNPTNGQVEVTKRRWAFDLNKKSHIEIKGFNIFAASVNTDQANQCIIDDCWIHFASFDRRLKGGFNRDRGMNIDTEGLGIVLGGNSNIVRNSVIAYCTGDGISIYGENNTVEYCVIHDCDISASDCAPVNCTGTGHRITGCEIYNAGRSGIVHRKLAKGRIENNHIYNCGLMTNDLGGTYTFQTKGQGTVIAYNIVHDIHCHTGVGIYVDNMSPDHTVHHNLCYNNEDCGIRLNTPTSNVLIYNNTLTQNGKSIAWWGAKNNDKQDGTVLINNIMTDSVSLGSGATESKNYMHKYPGYINSCAKDFRLEPGSPCIDSGKVIKGINESYTGKAPDIGCFEFGQDTWKAGRELPGKIGIVNGW